MPNTNFLRDSTDLLQSEIQDYSEPLKKIVFAVSNNPLSDDKIIEPVRTLAKMHKSKLKILHIADKKTPQVEKVLKAIEELNPEVEYTFGTGDTNKDLNDYLLKNSSDFMESLS